MNIEEILNELLELWPEEIELSGEKLHDSGGATFPALIAAHDLVEELALKKGIEHEAMDWAIYQTLHNEAKSIITNDGSVLRPREITVDSVKNNYESNLSSINEERNSNAT